MFRFKELIELWRSDNLLTQAVNDSHVMLESTYEMFQESVRSLRESEGGEMGIDIYEKDRMVNSYEQEVRRKVLKHLAITGGVNIIPGLILTSIVIDIERIGDYTKNIMELAVAHPRRLRPGEHENDLKKVEEAITHLFKGVVSTIKTSDKEAAAKLMDGSLWISGTCDGIVRKLIEAEEPCFDTADAVSLALYVRYLKRVSSHLRNITSGIVNPFERIGFRRSTEE